MCQYVLLPCFFCCFLPNFQLVACAEIFSHKGLLEVDRSRCIDFSFIEFEAEKKSENESEETWARVCSAVTYVCSLKLGKVCEKVIQKLQDEADRVNAKLEETQEQLKEKINELCGKNAYAGRPKGVD